MSAFHDNSAQTQPASQAAPIGAVCSTEHPLGAAFYPWLMGAYGMAAAVIYREILRFLIMARVLGC